MSRKTRKKYSTIIIVFILLSVEFITYLFISNYPNIQAKKLLNKYGWDVLSGGKSNEEAVILNDEYLKREISVMQISAASEIGFNPTNYEGKTIVKYYYTLKQIGKNDQLRAEIWMYKREIISAYILHAENNVRIRFWSLDTPYKKILSEIE
ncbi:MAG: hypothetical protein K0S01_2108 [Herbinix sp.]|jgi:hypothetical protein|nr:hypothetical protein [Herbinix sp.]